MPYDLVSPFAPAGHQPRAIRELAAGLARDDRYQTLLGVTGSGKTMTMAHVIAGFGRPTLVLSHNKTLAAQLYGELKAFFPKSAVEFFISYYDYYQPEAYVPHRYVHREGLFDQRRHRSLTAACHVQPHGTRGRSDRGERVGDLRPGRPGGVPPAARDRERRRGARPRRPAGSAGRGPVPALPAGRRGRA